MHHTYLQEKRRMHIILENETVTHLKEKYTLLEIDQFQLEPGADPIQAYCVLDHLQVKDLFNLEEQANLHQQLIDNYRVQDWKSCERDLLKLQGCWNGQLDTFYEEIAVRIAKYKQQDPGADWTPVIQKY